MNGADIKKRKDRGIITEPRVYPLKVRIHHHCVEYVANDVAHVITMNITPSARP